MTPFRSVPGHALRTAVLACAALCAVPAMSAAPQGIAWQTASTDADVDKAFALAKQTGKPVFLYWGAVWCPPCNQVKATLFSRADFVERSRAFVPVYVDGDKPGAQKVASRFKVVGYPTMILFKPDGTEVTRLPGEVDPERYLLTLTAGLEAQVPVRTLLQRALDGQGLQPEQWRLLAFYSWDTDEQQVLPTKELGPKLSLLAAKVPADQPRVRDRLALKAIAARARSDARDEKSVEADRRELTRILGEPESAKDLWDVLVAHGERVVKYLEPAGAGRSALAAKLDAELARVLASGTLTRSDQVDGLDTRVALWKLGEGELTSAHKQDVLREVARITAASTDRYERQAVVPNAAHVLTQAGLVTESDALLKAELPRAVAPYYHMLVLGGNAKKRGDAKAALEWYETAWKKSEGPATRIQWGANYLSQVIELTPSDVARVTSAATALVGGLEPKAETFYERNQRSLQRLAKRLAEWEGKDPARAAAVIQVKSKLQGTCGKLPAKDPGRVNCEKVFSAEASTAS